jgi:hypothetical protein
MMKTLFWSILAATAFALALNMSLVSCTLGIALGCYLLVPEDTIRDNYNAFNYHKEKEYKKRCE